MPCYRCGARQTDPARGASPWRRGVRAGRQVLICPVCQRTDWTAELDHCEACGSSALVVRLGEQTCRDCGASTAAGVGDREQPSAPGLAEDVAAALQRRFDRR